MLILSKQLHADTGTVGQYDFAIDNVKAVEPVVGDKKIAVEVGPVHHGRELRGRCHGAACLRHASEHHLHAEGACEYSHFVGLMHAGAFHQLYVYGVVHAMGALHVGQTLQKFVGHER